jgi:hypothetical protein
MTLPIVPRNTSPYPRGTYSQIARRLGFTPQHVADVALQRRHNEAIARELKKAARKHARRVARAQKAAEHAA